MNSDSQVIEEDSDAFSDATENSGSSDELIGELGERFEVAKILSEKFHLPKDLCENPEIFYEFFSVETWNTLSEEVQTLLMTNYLPNFPENDETEKLITLQALFTNEIVRFDQAPLETFQRNLEDGNYRPDIAHYRKSIRKAEEREQRFQECERISRIAKNLMISREKLLRSAYMTPPGTTPIRVSRNVNPVPKLSSSAVTQRAKKRYFQEINEIAEEIGIVGPLSDDENYPEGPPTPLTRKQKKQLNMMQGGSSPGAEIKIVSTLTSSKLNNADSLFESSILSDDHYRKMLQTHKKRKVLEPDHPELEMGDIKLKDIYARTQLSLSHKKALSLNQQSLANKKNDVPKVKQETSTASSSTSSFIIMNPSPSTSNSFQQQLNRSHMLLGQQIQQPIKSVNVQERLIGKTENETDEEDWIKANIIKIEPRNEMPKKTIFPVPQTKKRPPSATTVQQKPAKKMVVNTNVFLTNHTINQFTKSDLEGVDTTNSPMDLDDAANSEPIDGQKGPELIQETHACFLSLVRDIFCSTPNHRMKLEELRRKIAKWLANPISPLNDWFGLADNWLLLLTSAINFLSGEFVDQPEDYVPYIEYKPQLNIYQWIGAGRDSDNHLLALCHYWLSRRHEMGQKPTMVKSKSEAKAAKNLESSLAQQQQQRCASPPPARWPTEWKVRNATDEEIYLFREQERRRYENPHMSFTYKQHGYESVVGPVKGIYTQAPGISKARDHNTLVADRPNFVTILALVRDATARLPNGEGTRADICELLKSSQYISTQATDQILQTIVSGALDRMHTEIDPCVKYDGKKKLWIYLHRNRSEEEFERLHLQQQGMTKHKKPIVRKVKSSKGGKSDSNEESPPSSFNSVSVIPEKVTTPIQNSQIIMAKSSFQKLNVSPSSMIKTLPALSQIENKPKIPIMQLSPPPLINKMSPKKIVSMKAQPHQQQQHQQPEPFDVEASLDAHTTPIFVKGQNIIHDASKVPKLTLKNLKDPMSPIKANSPNLIHRNSPNQSILIQNQSQSSIGQKKPVIISQSQAPPLVSQSNIMGVNLIPIMSNADGTTKMISSSVLQGLNAPKLVKTGSSEPPALTTKIPQKNIVKINPSMAGKTLMNPSLVGNQQPKLILTNSSKNLTVKNVQQQATPILSQQKQILQSILVQQQKQKSLAQNNSLLIATQNQGQQKMPALTLSSPTSTSLANPQGQQIIQTVNAANLTPQQQQSLLQTIKQQQMKMHGNQGQQTLIVKPQIIQQSSKVSPSSNVGEMSTAPPLVSMQSTTNSPGSIQTIAKIIKPGTTVVQHPTQVSNQSILVSRAGTITTNPPLMAKVLTSGAQLITLDMLQKQGATFKLAGAKPGQTGLIQLQGNQGQQFAQYVVSSKGKNILVGSPQRFITTQANIANNTKLIDSSSHSQTVTAGTSNVIIASPNPQQQQHNQDLSSQSNQQQTNQPPQQHQQIKIVQPGLMNAKLINVQGIGNKGIKTATGIKMVNTQNYIANIGGKSLLITGKPTTTTGNSAGSGNSNNQQGIVLQASGTPNGTSYILGSQGQPLKVQGNIITQGNVNILNQPNTSQTQTVMLGNQLVKVQQQQPKISTQQIQIVGKNNANSGGNQATNDTVVLTTTPGQTIKMQSNTQAGGSGTVNRTGPQQIILSSSLKNVIKNNAQGGPQQRVVLATPSGQPGMSNFQQIILPANFPGSAINFKTLQGLKVIPIAQQGGSSERVFARLLTTTTTPSPKQTANPNNNNNNSSSNNNPIMKDDMEIMDEIEIKDDPNE